MISRIAPFWHCTSVNSSLLLPRMHLTHTSHNTGSHCDSDPDLCGCVVRPQEFPPQICQTGSVRLCIPGIALKILNDLPCPARNSTSGDLILCMTAWVPAGSNALGKGRPLHSSTLGPCIEESASG